MTRNIERCGCGGWHPLFLAQSADTSPPTPSKKKKERKPIFANDAALQTRGGGSFPCRTTSTLFRTGNKFFSFFGGVFFPHLGLLPLHVKRRNTVLQRRQPTDAPRLRVVSIPPVGTKTSGTVLKNVEGGSCGNSMCFPSAPSRSLARRCHQ